MLKSKKEALQEIKNEQLKSKIPVKDQQNFYSTRIESNYQREQVVMK